MLTSQAGQRTWIRGRLVRKNGNWGPYVLQETGVGAPVWPAKSADQSKSLAQASEPLQGAPGAGESRFADTTVSSDTATKTVGRGLDRGPSEPPR